MREICVEASRAYRVQVGSGLLARAGEAIALAHSPCRAAIVSDSNVWPIYGEKLVNSLKSAGFNPVFFVFPAGEASKTGETYLTLLNFLAENRLTRADLPVALGGGVVGDVCGFAAATYLRGVEYVQLATSVLAAVDSSVGGKTAIDLPAGKNLAGAFWQPSLVIADCDALATLPPAVFRDGCAEIIKYALLYDAPLFALLEQTGLDFPREEVIARCVEWKRRAVQADEFDRGERMKLNLGHTLGHGVEARSGFAISHGCAVAIGMALICEISAAKNWCDASVFQKTKNLLEQFGFSTACPFPASALAEAALSDKKRRGGLVSLIVPREIGRCDIVPTPVDGLLPLLRLALRG